MTLSLETVNYNDNYKMLYGSLTQLVRGFSEMRNRLENQEQDAYKQVLYPVMKDLVDEVVTEYSKLLVSNNNIENEVKSFQLNGYNGAVCKTSFKAPFVKNVNPNLVYKYANFGDYLKVMKQRCNYFKKTSVPVKYINNTEYTKVFNNLCASLDHFSNTLDNVESRFFACVALARDIAGVTVKETKPVKRSGTKNVGREISLNKSK